jgi:hypothetical protein
LRPNGSNEEFLNQNTRIKLEQIKRITKRPIVAKNVEIVLFLKNVFEKRNCDQTLAFFFAENDPIFVRVSFLFESIKAETIR